MIMRKKIMPELICIVCGKAKKVLPSMVEKFRTCSRACAALNKRKEHQKQMAIKRDQTEKTRDVLLMVLGSTDPKDVAAYLGFAITYIENKDLMPEFTSYLKKINQISIKIR